MNQQYLITNKNKTMDEPIILICDCSNAEHQIIFRSNEEDLEVYMTVHLTPQPFLKRIKHGIKYIFGYRCSYGDFQEVILSNNHVESLKKITKLLQ